MRGWPGLLLVASLLAGSRVVPAQADFAARYARAEGLPVAEVAARKQAFAEAHDAFVALPLDGEGYRTALVPGARSALFAGRYRQAVDLFAEARKRLGPLDEANLPLRLSALLRAEAGVEAAALARESSAARPAGVQTWLLGGVSWLPRGSDFGRIAELGGELLRRGEGLGLWLLEAQDRAMAGKPGRYYAQANLALAYRMLGRIDAAENTYREAIRLAPRIEWLWNDLGLLGKGTGHYDGAAHAFLRALSLDEKPGTSAAGTNLGLLFQRTGKNRGRDPQADLQVVVRARPDAALPRRLLLDGLARGQVSKAR